MNIQPLDLIQHEPDERERERILGNVAALTERKREELSQLTTRQLFYFQLFVLRNGLDCHNPKHAQIIDGYIYGFNRPAAKKKTPGVAFYLMVFLLGSLALAAVASLLFSLLPGGF